MSEVKLSTEDKTVIANLILGMGKINLLHQKIQFQPDGLEKNRLEQILDAETKKVQTIAKNWISREEEEGGQS